MCHSHTQYMQPEKNMYYLIDSLSNAWLTSKIRENIMPFNYPFGPVHYIFPKSCRKLQKGILHHFFLRGIFTHSGPSEMHSWQNRPLEDFPSFPKHIFSFSFSWSASHYWLIKCNHCPAIKGNLSQVRISKIWMAVVSWWGHLNRCTTVTCSNAGIHLAKCMD